MRGCVSLPLRLALLALLILGGYVVWSNHDAIRRRVHQWTADTGPREAVGRGNAALAPAARRKIASLRSTRPDSVVLSPGDVANLITAGAREQLPGALDSIEVRMDKDQIEVRGQVDTRKVPFSFGPLAGVVRDREPVEAGGRLVFRRAGLAEWEVTRASVRGIPVPKDVVGSLLRRFSAGAESVLPVPLPASVGGLRVSSTGLVLYGLAPTGVPR